MITTTISPDRTLRRRLKVICCLMLTAANLKAAASDWSFDVNPYLWAASVAAETSLPSTPPGVDQFETKISAGAMLAAEARYRSFGLFVDFVWVRSEERRVGKECRSRWSVYDSKK